VWALATLEVSLRESPTPIAAAEAVLSELMAELGLRPAVRFELIMGQAILAQLRGDDLEAWRLFDVARELEHDLGRRRTSRSWRNHGRMLLRAERFDEAAAVLAPYLELLERLGGGPEAVVAAAHLAITHAGAGKVGDARSGAAAAAARAAADGGYEPRAVAHLAVCEVHLAEGSAEAAVSSAREAVSVAGTGDWVLLNADARMALARALRAAGDHRSAADEAAAAASLWGAKGAVALAAEARAFGESLTLTRG
jgi:tetratricopeptide (TPR) repeat protein